MSCCGYKPYSFLYQCLLRVCINKPCREIDVVKYFYFIHLYEFVQYEYLKWLWGIAFYHFMYVILHSPVCKIRNIICVICVTNFLALYSAYVQDMFPK